MDKHKEIAEKITYALDGYISDHNNRNFGDADGWLRHIRNGWEDFIEAHPDCLNFHEYLQNQQTKVEELQRRNQMLSESTLEMGGKLIRETDLINQQASTLFRLREFIYGSGDLREYTDEELLEHQRILKAIVVGEQALKGEVLKKDLQDFTKTGIYTYTPEKVALIPVGDDDFKFISQTHVISKGIHYTRSFVNGRFTEWQPLKLKILPEASQ